jgi:AcrR family transcriptional regulator
MFSRSSRRPGCVGCHPRASRAVDLFTEQGYDATTVAQIAERAGVTRSTFFRHFPDKREVLFDGEADLRAALIQAVVEAPENLEPFDALLCAFRKSARNLENDRPFSEPRWKVIAVTPALRERELAKHAWLTDAVAEALRQRDVGAEMADLAARTGWAAYQHAVQAWVDDPAQGLDARLRQAFDDLRALSAAALPAQADSEH